MDSLRGARNLAAWLNKRIAILDPGCFALVMATGIISNSLWFESHRTVSDAFLAINVLAYCWLAVLTTLRLIRFPRSVWADMTNWSCGYLRSPCGWL
jgi:tellurite resistance protein TehA-like permease